MTIVKSIEQVMLAYNSRGIKVYYILGDVQFKNIY